MPERGQEPGEQVLATGRRAAHQRPAIFLDAADHDLPHLQEKLQRAVAHLLLEGGVRRTGEREVAPRPLDHLGGRMQGADLVDSHRSSGRRVVVNIASQHTVSAPDGL